MKTAFVTGGNRGLGKGFVEYLLNEDFLVFAGARNPSGFDDKLRKNPNLRVVKIDISNDESIEEAVKEISKEVDHIDYLINNAGINKNSVADNQEEKVCELSKLDRKLLQKMFDVNSISPMIVIQKFIELLKSKPSFIINVSSCRASFHDEFDNTEWGSREYGYKASKLALNMMTFCTVENLPDNVKTFAVHPGEVKTDMNPAGENTPYEQAEKMINITRKWEEKFNGKFLRYDGSYYPL